MMPIEIAPEMRAAIPETSHNVPEPIRTELAGLGLCVEIHEKYTGNRERGGPCHGDRS
jgi:hypothetical protein